ncbi:MAG TPA: ABC transporter permease subunit, partial [Spirochaetia bacterium]|nr:ABC transporter permease subunit [Spirochaetia bacterium]
SIIYLAALASVDPELHEAATVDGASRFQRTVHVDFPGILPTVVIVLILSLGQIMNLGFEKAYLMQNPLNLTSSEIIQTYVYKVGMSGVPQFSYAAAIGLFNSVINLVLVLGANQVARRLGGVSLW